VTAWRLRPRLDLRWEDWGDRWSLYQGAAGETHLLDPIGAALLQGLQAAPSSLETILARLAAECAVAVDAPLRARVVALLRRFDELGLIEPVADPAA